MTTPPDPEVLKTAQARQRQGRSLLNSEVSALRAFEKIKIKAESDAAKRNKISVYDTSTNMLAGKDTLSAQAGAGSAPGDVLAALIASGATFTEFTYCDSGTPATAWWPIWASDPTPP